MRKFTFNPLLEATPVPHGCENYGEGCESKGIVDGTNDTQTLRCGNDLCPYIGALLLRQQEASGR